MAAARQQITAILQQNAQIPEQLCSDFSAQFGELAAVDEAEFLEVTDLLAHAPWHWWHACWSCLPSCTAAAPLTYAHRGPCLRLLVGVQQMLHAGELLSFTSRASTGQGECSAGVGCCKPQPGGD